eukprot:5682454-Amphidinium_carterae.1
MSHVVCSPTVLAQVAYQNTLLIWLNRGCIGCLALGYTYRYIGDQAIDRRTVANSKELTTELNT